MTRNAPELRECRECHLWFAKADRIFCDLCRKWFCTNCYRDQHWFSCPKNPREPECRKPGK